MVLLILLDQVKSKTVDSFTTMKHYFRFLCLLISSAVLGCGGGGGGGGGSGGGSSGTSSGTTYLVTTLTLDAALNSPKGIATDGTGNLYVTDTGTDLVLKIANLGSVTANVTRMLGGGATDYSSCLNSKLYDPYGIAIDNSGFLYVAEHGKSLIRYADCTLDMSAEYGSTGAGLTLSSPGGVALRNTDLYVSDSGNHKIRKITKTGVGSGTTTTVAGTSNGYVNGLVGNSAFSQPTGIAVSSGGDIFVADTNNCSIRLITSGGVVSTFAGSGPNVANTGPISCGSSDGTSTAAQFDHPTGIAVDANNNLYVADSVNNKIRRITPAGVVTTIAGSGAGVSTDGAGAAASFNTPTGIVVDASGNLFVVDSGSQKIRKITITP